MGDDTTIAADLADLRGAGAAMLGLGDAVERLGRREVLAGRDAYGCPELAAAAGRFADRYGHLVRSTGGALHDAGEVLRSTAGHYEDADVMAPVTRLSDDLLASSGEVLA